jgi:hypothetical protein
VAAVVSTPHFRHPFQFGKGGVMTVEQDSDEELAGCAIVALLYERGQRIGMPDFGLPDQAMLQRGANLDQITAASREHDERLDASAEQAGNIKQGVEHVRVVLKLVRNG